MQKPKALVLFSGGFDSVVILHEAIHQGFEPVLFFIEYGQRNWEQEFDAFNYWRKALDLEFKIVSIPPIKWTKSALFDTNTTGEEDNADENIQYIEMRNLIFFSYALSYAESQNIIEIYAALLNGTFADGNASFAKLFDNLAFQTLNIQFNAPYKFMSKLELKKHAVESLGLDLRMLLNHSISCNLVDAEGKPCGVCGDCDDIRIFEKEISGN